MSRTANTSTSGQYCGRAAAGISKLTHADLAQIEALRTGDRPMSWQNLALRYGVNELDLRALFDPENEGRMKAPAPTRNPKAERDAIFRSMWVSGVPGAEIMAALKISNQTMRNFRDRLGLPKRSAGRPKSSWNREIAA